MIVALQLPSTAGDIAGNSKALVDAVGEAMVAYNADLCLTSAGYLSGLPASFLEGTQGYEATFLATLETMAHRLRLAPAVLVGGTCATFAAPFFEEAVYLLHGGQVQRICTYSEGFGILNLDGQEILVTLRDGLERAIVKGFVGLHALVHLDAYPFIRGAVYARETHLRMYAMMLACPCVSVNALGFAGGRVYHGNSFVVDSFGLVVGRAPLFTRTILPIRCAFEDEPSIKSPCDPQHTSDMSLFWDALVFGLGDMVRTSPCSSVVIGLSGGMDSALVAALAVSALGKDKVVGVLMPSPWSSQGSLDDAAALADALGIVTHTIYITPLMDSVEASLQAIFHGRARDVTEENIQARLRGLLLMAFANKFGALVLAPGNKSELAMGYCTLYGDMVGALAPIGDVYKTEVYGLASWYNSLMKRQCIPQATFEKAPSAELRPNQVDQDSLPPYEQLDAILQALLEGNTMPEQIVVHGASSQIVADVIQRYMANAFKHTAAAPCVQVSSCALAREARLPEPFHYRVSKEDIPSS